ncbi:MAG: hypothetical protein WCJ40_19140 [Planctomycetota bacterium]|nr:hypothetical protein [Planctomycetota bacterium]
MLRKRLCLGLFGFLMFGMQSADAQLLPNLFIRRQRPDPSTESPIAKMNRDQYFGLHPTEWRRFPAGWGLTNPEAINREDLMQQVAKEVKRLDEEFGQEGGNAGGPDQDLPPRGGAGAGAGAANRGRDQGDAIPRPVPLPSDSDSPFNLDKPAPVKPDLDTKPRTSPPSAPELPAPGDSPFDLPAAKPGPGSIDIPPRPKPPAQPRTGSVDFLDSTDVASVEAPPEVMRAPQRSMLRDVVSGLNPRSWMRR